MIKELFKLVIAASVGFFLAEYIITPTKEIADCMDSWQKLSNGVGDNGHIVTLDMTQGYSASDGLFIYLVVKDRANGDNIVIAFPDGDYWKAPGIHSRKSRPESVEWNKD